MTKLKAWLSLGVALLAAFLGYRYKRRGEQLEEARVDVTKEKLGSATSVLKERAENAQEAHTHALEEYNRLKRLHAAGLTGTRRAPGSPDGQPPQ